MRWSILALLFAGTLCSHETGTTRVSILIPDSRMYEVEIVTDAGSLLEKLASTSGSMLPAAVAPANLESLLASFDEQFRQRVKLAFDGAEVRPAIAYSAAPGGDPRAGSLATIRLTGAIPPDVQQLTWRYSWTFASYALTIRRAGSATPATEWLEGGQTSAPFNLAAPPLPVFRLDTARRYLTLGFTHIVPHGLDHMLFVLGIFLLSRRARTVLWQVSAFTVAHSITLALSMYGVVNVAPRVVEPLIALSIAYVAIENIFTSELKSWRVVLVFGFGLLHGLGFAGALQELGLPRAEFVTALLAFNAGVEVGQLSVIAAAFLLVGWHCANRAWYRSRVVVPASMMIACMAVWWTIQRLTL